jgi:urea transport system permease protein
MNQPLLVTATQKAGPKVTIAVGAVVLALLIALPLLSLLPAENALSVSAYTLTLVGKILCYAIVALALDLVWGYAGLLSLGHGSVLRPRRLCDGHVPDASGCRRWLCRRS